MERLPKKICPARSLSNTMKGKALFCRGLTAGAYLDGILGALLTELVRRSLSSAFTAFPVLIQGELQYNGREFSGA
ncbi:MAG: hypothetical protein NTW96_24310 [Planctomycetia bacterium]|nr:hypothetical protein [Planctomycetia bacterium]